MNILLLVCFISMFYCIFMYIKNINTFNNHEKIATAIYRKLMEDISYDRLISFSDMEPYDTTLFRFWDWGYKNILPSDKYEIIKDYIK